GGRPTPSGATLMSQGARSAGAIGCPRPGPSADIAGAAASSTPAQIIPANGSKLLRIGIARLPFLVDAPTGDRVVVVDAAQPALGGELRARGLHHAGLVGGAALQHGGTAVPPPGRAEARERLRQDRFL